MKNYIQKSIPVIILSLVLLIPDAAQACGMGALGAAASGDFFVILIGIFLAGYLPYIFFSIKLLYDKRKRTRALLFTRVVATIFAVINTVVYVIGVFIIATIDVSLLIGDFFLWGIPFTIYILGMIPKKSKE